MGKITNFLKNVFKKRKKIKSPYNDEDFGFIEKKKEKTVKHLSKADYKIL